MAAEVALPIDPPKRNVNSRLALETGELVRAKNGDRAVGIFYQAVSRTFFTKHADISKPEVIVSIAKPFGIAASEIEDAWHEHRFSPAVEMFMGQGRVVGVTGVPAMAWPNRPAIIGMMPAADLARLLRSEAPGA